jgi:hypothetical protein
MPSLPSASLSLSLSLSSAAIGVLTGVSAFSTLLLQTTVHDRYVFGREAKFQMSPAALS